MTRVERAILELQAAVAADGCTLSEIRLPAATWERLVRSIEPRVGYPVSPVQRATVNPHVLRLTTTAAWSRSCGCSRAPAR